MRASYYEGALKAELIYITGNQVELLYEALLSHYLKANGQLSVNHMRIYQLLFPKHIVRPIRPYDGLIKIPVIEI
ncbi:MAG TPA: hypothetical protein PLM71_11475 [Syntrophorhabdaceae bacterium]|nr:hypothetical protein [Syntrophorhabdaceae bacterium]HPU30914.1 hypothetical protein [Syntrophorhabdaceae bacterium]